MKNILCFGDSNTYGYIPIERKRYAYGERWPGLLAAALGGEYHIIEEGLNGRTTAFTDYLEPDRNALEYIGPCILSHAPLDLVIIMLGTNDTKGRYSVTAKEIADGMKNLVKKLRFSYPTDKFPGLPQILIVAPAILFPTEADPAFNEESTKKVLELPKRYEALAEELGCRFFNAQTVLSEKELGGDGLHFKREGHKKLAAALEKEVRSIL